MMIPTALFCLYLLSAGSSSPALSEKKTVELIGKIVQKDGKPFHGVTPVVFLHGATTPFSTRALVEAGGEFKFKKLLPGMYTLIAAVPRAGELRKTIDVGPSHADSRGRIFVTVVFEEATSASRSHTVSAVELSVPEAALAEYSKAHQHLEKRDVQAAVACAKKALELAPQFVAAWNLLGTIAYQSREYAQAEKYFREALNQDPEAYSPLVNLGGALLSLMRIPESLEVNLRAVKAKPDDALANSQLGKSYFHLGQFDDAVTHLKQAKSLDPAHFSLPQLILAEIYQRRGDYQGVIRELEELLKMHPDSALAPEFKKALERTRALASSGKAPTP